MAFSLSGIISSVFGNKAIKDAVINAAITKVAGGSDRAVLASGLGSYAAGKYGMPSTGTSPTINPNVATARTSIEKAIEAATNMYYDAVEAANYIEAQKAETQINNLKNELTKYPTTTGGIPSVSGTPDWIKKIGDYIGFGGKSGLEDAYGKNGIMSNFPGGGMGMAAMGLLGKATYDDYKRREGGLADTPQVSMDALGRYQLANALGTGGTREEFGLSPAPASLDFDAMNRPVAAAGGGLISRQYFNKGGIAEKDMREGGESEGPGTGTSDDVPAMLSDGEFVMTAAATKGAGAYDLNKTKKGIELIKTTDSDRERGVTNMRELMNIFEAV
jgi:hypothetical protein